MGSKRSHRIALLISGTIGLVAFSFVIIEHLKIRSFKNALAELVETKTDGEYKLVIEKSDINLRTLDFQLENLHIEKTDKNNSGKGIHVVHIPFIKANFGSLKSFFDVGQVTIEELVIAEPSIEIDTKSEDHRTQFNIAHTLIRIFPAVESILDRFDIQLLRISRGNIKIQKGNSELLHLKLIDLLVHEWDMRQLTVDSRLQLNIQGQQVDLNKSSFAFSEVEFKYPDHYLIFKDFLFESTDSTTGSKIAVKGKSVLINQLDYNELYNNQRFKLHKIEILEPHFTGRLATIKTRRRGSDHYEHPLMDIMKQTFGEVDLDSAIIKDAQLDLTLAINDDSVASDVPRVNIVLNSFKVLKDSSRLQIGEIFLDLAGTEIKLNDKVKLTCSKMSMGEHRRFTLSDARIADIKTDKTFIDCEKITMQDFKVLSFIFDKRILASHIELENANVTIAPEYLKLFPNLKAGSGRKILPDVKNVTLRNVNVNYYNGDTQAHLKGVNAVIHNIREFSGKISPQQVSALRFNSFNARLKKSDLSIRTGMVDLNARYANIQKLDLSLAKFHFTADYLNATPVQLSDSMTINLHHWDSVEAGTLTATGEIPRLKVSERNVSTLLNHFQIRNFTSDITYGETKVSFKANGLSGKGISVGGKGFYFDELLGKIYQFKKEGGEHNTQIDSLVVDTKKSTSIHQVKYQGRNLSASIPYLEIDQVDGETDSKSIERVFATNIRVHQLPEDSLAHIDSLFVFDLQLKGDHKPMVNEIEIFNPVIRLGQHKSNEPSPGEPSNMAKNFDFVNKFKIHKAHIALQYSDITVLGNLTGELENGSHHFIGEGLQWRNNKATISISRVDIAKDDTFVEHLKFDPNQHYYDSLPQQTDIISGELRNIRLKSFSLDSILRSKTIHSDSVTIGDFSLHIKRDKRLPNPPLLEKPVTLDALLHKSKIFTKGIIIKNGNLSYEEVSAKTGGTGKLEMEDIRATVSKKGNADEFLSLEASAKLYNQAPVSVQYNTLDSTSFNLSVNVEPFDLTLLNQMVLPLQSMEIKSGRLGYYKLFIDANHEFAEGEATMTYDDLHLVVFKPNEPEKKNIGSELLTLLADGIILKHDKENAVAAVKQPRLPEKSIFNYWVKSAVHGTMNVIRHGKKKRNKQLSD